MIKSIFLVSVIGKMIALEINFNIGTQYKLQTISFSLDLSFDNLLINQNAINCSDYLGCRFVDSSVYYDVYDYFVYSYKKARVNLLLFDESDHSLQEITVDVRIADYQFNIFGLNPNSILKEALGKKAITLDLLNKRAKINNGEPGDPMHAINDDNKLMYYFSGKLKSVITMEDKESIVTYNTINICFHDRDATAPHNFFLAGPASFFLNQSEINSKLAGGRRIVTEQCSIIFKDYTDNFDITYDTSTLSKYNEPFYVYRNKYHNQCHLFLGDFALLEGKVKLIIKANNSESKLIINARAIQKKYIPKPVYHYFYIIYTLVMFVLVMGILFYLRSSLSREDQINKDKGDMIIHTSFEKGLT